MGENQPLLHICHAPSDRGWVHGRMVRELGLEPGQYHTREEDGLGELQVRAIAEAVETCRYTVLVASTAARWDQVAQLAATLAQHAGLEGDSPRLIVLARDFAPGSDVEHARLSLAQRALVSLDCSDDERTTSALARLRGLLMLGEPVDDRPACPYPGLAPFTAANRDLLFGRDADRDALLQRIRAGQRRILVVGPSGSGKSSLIHAAVLPTLSAAEHRVHVVPRGENLAAALRATVDALEVPGLGAAIDAYREAVRDASDAEIEQARARLLCVAAPDPRRRIIVIDPLEEVFADDDADVREALFARLGGLWSLPWCTVILCMRADFYGHLMAERCWRELEPCQYAVVRLDEAGLRAAIVEPATRAGVHVGILATAVVALVFWLQTQALSQEQQKTRRSINTAMKTADAMVFELNKKLSTVACAGASAAREAMVKRLRELVSELRTIGDLSPAELRTAMVGKMNEAQLALELGHLEQADVLYHQILVEAVSRVVEDPGNTLWQHGLSVSYEKLGEVAVSAGKLEDARGWFEKALAVARALVATDASNAQWRRDLCISLGRVAVVAREPAVTAKYLAEAGAMYRRLQRDGLLQGDPQLAELGVWLEQPRKPHARPRH